MANFVFTTWPFAGHLHPAIAVGHALRARGHQVAFYTAASARSLVEKEGFQFLPFCRVDGDRIHELVASEFPYCPNLWSRIRHARRLRDKLTEFLINPISQQVEDLTEVFKSRKVDVLVCDPTFWGPMLVLHQAWRIPVAVLSITAACVLPGPDAPPWGQGKPRPRTGAARFYANLERSLVKLVSRGFRGLVNRKREMFGLPALHCSATEFTGTLPLYLVPSAPEYDYQRRDLPPSVHYVGPCLWDKPSGEPFPSWLEDLPRDQPLIYVTEATIGRREPFLLKAAAAAFRNRPVQVVITTGKQRNVAELDLGEAAPNIRVEPYIPQSDLLPRTTVMVTLGGSGGVLAALGAGVPLVVVPTEWDRPENAQRVADAGAGLRIAADRCTPERLRAAVERVMTEPSFRENARRLASAFGKYRGPMQAAELLETLAVSTENQSVSAESYLLQEMSCASPHESVS